MGGCGPVGHAAGLLRAGAADDPEGEALVLDLDVAAGGEQVLQLGLQPGGEAGEHRAHVQQAVHAQGGGQAGAVQHAAAALAGRAALARAVLDVLAGAAGEVLDEPVDLVHQQAVDEALQRVEQKVAEERQVDHPVDQVTQRAEESVVPLELDVELRELIVRAADLEGQVARGIRGRQVQVHADRETRAADGDPAVHDGVGVDADVRRQLGERDRRPHGRGLRELEIHAADADRDGAALAAVVTLVLAEPVLHEAQDVPALSGQADVQAIGQGLGEQRLQVVLEETHAVVRQADLNGAVDLVLLGERRALRAATRAPARASTCSQRHQQRDPAADSIPAARAAPVPVHVRHRQKTPCVPARSLRSHSLTVRGAN